MTSHICIEEKRVRNKLFESSVLLKKDSEGKEVFVFKIYCGSSLIVCVGSFNLGLLNEKFPGPFYVFLPFFFLRTTTTTLPFSIFRGREEGIK